MNYTKGNWKVDGMSIIVSGAGTIANIPNVQDGGTFEFVANAHLISAAPDMYRILEAMIAYDKDGLNRWDWVVEHAKLAIAKAKGK